MRLAIAHPAQPQPVVDALAELRKLDPGTVASMFLALAGSLGHRFDFDALGEIILAASDDDLLRMTKPTTHESRLARRSKRLDDEEDD